MKEHKIFGSIVLLITALIWGSAFVAQSMGTKFLGPFTFNGLRALIAVGGLSILLLIIWLKDKKAKLLNNKRVILFGMLCGLFLFMATTLQQAALSMNSVGKTGFITSLYVILVPLLGVIFKHKISLKIWLCVLLSVIGLYFLCFTGSFTFNFGDLLLLLSSLGFSFQIIIVDRILKDINPILLSIIQFSTIFILSIIPICFFEQPTIDNTLSAIPYLLFTGILSSGVAYTLQIVGQKHTTPTISSLIMSLEAVFAAITAYIILDEALSFKEYLGCAIIFIAIIISQINFKKKC